MTDFRYRLPDRYWALGLLVLLLVLLPVFGCSPYLLTIMIFIGLYTIITIGLCLLMGYAGQISLGQAAFYGLGAYTSAIVTTKYSFSSWLGLPLSMALTGGVAFVIARPIFRLKGNYLAMATLGLGYIFYIMFSQVADLTGGPSGLTGVPYLSIAGWAFDRDIEYYYLVWAIAAMVLLASLHIINSRVGRALRAIHASEVAARSMGVDIDRLKAQIFVISAMYAGLAGSLYAHYVTFVSPSPFGFHFSVMLVVMAAVGGLATVWGAPFGVAVVVLLTEALRAVAPRFTGHGSAEYEIIAFGILLMLVMIYIPQGVVQGLSGIYLRRLKRRPIAARMDSRNLVMLPVLRRWFKLRG